MHLALVFTRILFFILSVFFITAYMISGPSGFHINRLGAGLLGGCLLGALLIGFDILFRRFNLRSFNIAIVGLFFGYLMGQALVWILSAILQISFASFHLSAQTIEIIKISLFLFGVYLGSMLTLRASDELYVSIPFVRFSPLAQKKKDLLVETSIISDPRILDLAASGILDAQLVLPQFLIKELYVQSETGSEDEKTRAKRSLENIKKLEEMPDLELRYQETDFPEISDLLGKMIRLARLLETNILTADLSQLQVPVIEGIKFINLHDLSKAFKPLMESGQQMKIKVQRYGKEPKQGVGYLEDGTMVVVNGGGEFIGETIDVNVLSVKHTSSGRIIFCNANSHELRGLPPLDEGDH